MNIEKLSLEKVPSIAEKELRLKPGLNVLRVPTENLRRLIVDTARQALGTPSGVVQALAERTLADAQVLSAGDLKVFHGLSAAHGVSKAVLAAGVLGGWRFPGAMGKLREQTEAIWTSRGTPGPQLAELLDSLAEVRRERRAIMEKLAQAPRLHARLKAQEARLAQAERFEAEQAQRLAHTLKLEAAKVELVRFEKLEVERNLRARLREFPQDGVATLEAMQKELEALKAKREPVLHASAEIQRELDEQPERNADLLEAELKTLLDLQRERLEQQTVLAERTRAFEARKKKLEAQIAANEVKKLEIGDALLEANEFLAYREGSWRTAKKIRERIEAEVRRLSVEVAKLPVLSSDVVTSRVSGLQRLLRAREERERVSLETAKCDEQLRALIDGAWSQTSRGQPFTVWKGAVLAAGILLILVGAMGLTGSESLGDVASAVGALLVLGVGIERALAFRNHWVQRDTEREEHARRQRQGELERERLALERRATELDRELVAVSTSLAVSAKVPISRIELLLFEAQRELSQFQRRQRLTIQLETYAGLLSAAVADEARAKVDRDVADSRVSGLERRFTGTGDTTPAAMLRQRMLDFRTEEAALLADRRACDSGSKALLEQVRRHGVQTQDAAEAASELARRAEALRAPSLRLRELEERRHATDAQLHVLHRLCGQKAEAIHALMEPWGCSDELSFRARAAEAARYRTVLEELGESATRIEQTVGLTLPEVRAQLAEVGGSERLERRLRQYERSHLRAWAKVHRLTKRRDVARARLEGWGNAERVELLARQEEALEASAERLVKRFAVDRLALGLLARRVNQWERESRPLAVELASETFGRLTGGAYVHVDVEAEDAQALVVQDALWKRLRPEALPTEAREALFIAFRLASLQEAGGRRWPLPIVVDRLFTGKDVELLRNGLGVLTRLAEKHQVLLVTTDARVLKLLEPGKAHVVEVHLAPPLTPVASLTA